MGSFTRYSQIETYRRRRHGIASRFRFLKDSQDGYVVISELTSKFYVKRKFDTQIGAYTVFLVFDIPDDFGIAEVIADVVFGDLVDSAEVGAPYKRYTVTTETTPSASKENRYRFMLTAAFNDTTPIVP